MIEQRLVFSFVKLTARHLAQKTTLLAFCYLCSGCFFRLGFFAGEHSQFVNDGAIIDASTSNADSDTEIDTETETTIEPIDEPPPPDDPPPPSPILTPALLTLSPTVYAFSDIIVGDTLNQAFVVENHGELQTSNFTVTIVSGVDFTLGSNTCAAVLAPAQTCTFSVTFGPNSVGAKTDSVALTYDDGQTSGQSLSANLTGNGLAVPTPPRDLSYSHNLVTYLRSVAIPNNVPTVTGTVSGFSLTSGTLPTGLSIDPATGVISGTPTSVTQPRRSIAVRASNAAGYTEATIELGVADGFVVTSTGNQTDASPGNGECRAATSTCSGTCSSVGTCSGAGTCDCTLKAVFQEVNALAGGTARAVYLPNGTYPVNTVLRINNANRNVSVTGESRSATIIDLSTFGGNAGIAIDTPGSGSMSTFTLSALTLRNTPSPSVAVEYENGWYEVAYDADFIVSDCLIQGHRAGAVVIDSGSAQVRIEHSDFIDNEGYEGAAIMGRNTTQAITIHHSRFSDNRAQQGGAISGWVDVYSSVFENNAAISTGGGAIWLDWTPAGFTSTIEDSIFVGNTALVEGGALDASTDFVGTFTVRRSTFYDNTAEYAGAWYIPNATTVAENTTIVGNHGDAGTGGISNGAGLTLVSSTIVDNHATALNHASDGPGGGIFIDNDDRFYRQDSIIANNTAGGTPVNCGGSNVVGWPLSTGHMLYDSAGGACGTTVGTDSMVADVGLDAALADNGGPVLTLGIRADSPALDKIPTCSVSTDARGIARPRGPACDIGAFER